MYNLPYHKEEDAAAVLAFINQYPFAFLTICDEQHRPVATQVPLLAEEREGTLYLTGHVMRNTDHHKALLQNPYALAVFTGPHTYVSATWYSSPKGSTWNYMSVHAKGNVRLLDEEGLIKVMKKLTLHFENGNAESNTTFDNLPASYTAPLVKAIAGFEIAVDDLDTVFKLSQDRDETSYHNIIEKLTEQGGDGKLIADIMRQRKHLVFGAQSEQ
jgi:transcriptional regulator